MTTLADAKLTALEALTGNTGHVNDLEAELLVSLGATAGKALVDQWFEVFDAAAVSTGHFNDRAIEYIVAQVGAPPSDDYNAHWQFFWENFTGGAVAPPKSANLQLWYDLTDVTQCFSDIAGTVQCVDGAEVRRVNDKGTTGVEITENSTFVPEYDTGNPIGLNCAGLTGFSLGSVTPGGTTGAAGITFAAVMQRQDIIATLRDVFAWASGPEQIRIRIDTIPLAAQAGWQVRFSTAGSDIFAGADAPGEWLYIIATINQSTGAYEIRNGTQVFTGTSSYTSFTPTGFDLAQLDGCVGEVLVYDVECNSAELDAIEAYFNAKYGTLPQQFAPFQANLSHWWDFTDQSEVFADTAGTVAITDGTVIERVNDKGLAGDDLEDASSGMTWEDSVVNGHSVARNTVVQVPARFTSQALTTLIGGVGGFTYGGVHKLFSVPGGQGILHAIDNGPSEVTIETGFGDWSEDHPNQGTTPSNKAIVPDEWVSHIVSDGGPGGYIQHVSGAVDVTAIANFAIQTGTPVEIFAQSVEGDIAEILVYDRGLTAAELLVLQAYYDTKYGLLPFIGLPTPVADLIHHYDFTDNATVFRNLPGTQQASDGDAIRLIVDKGTQVANLTSASGANSPTYRENFIPIGQNVADFSPGALSKPMSGTDIPGQLGAKGMSNALVFRLQDPNGPAVQMADWGVGVGRLRVLRDFGAGFMLYDYPGPVGGFSTGVITPGAWYLWYASVTGSTTPSDDRFRLSGEVQQIASLIAPFDILPGEPIELSHLTAQNFQIAEWAVWDGPLTDPELAALEAYVLAKYGVLPTAPAAPLVWWDFTDINTLFTDAARTTPVTADGDEIKGVFDKGRGLLHLEPQGTNGPRFTTAGINGLSTADFDDTNAESLISTIAHTLDDSNSFPDPDYNFLIVGEYDDAGAGAGAGRHFDWPSQVMGTINSAAVPITRVKTLDDEVDQEQNVGGNFAAWGEVTGNDGKASINGTAGVASVNDFPPSLSSVKPTVGGGSGTGSEVHGFVSEIIIWDSAGDLPTQADIEQYVTLKYGLTWA